MLASWHNHVIVWRRTRRYGCSSVGAKPASGSLTSGMSAFRRIGPVLLHRVWRWTPGSGLRASFCRALNETALDSHATIRQVLSAVVADFLVPNSARSLSVEASNNSSSFGRSVDSDPSMFVVNLENRRRTENVSNSVHSKRPENVGALLILHLCTWKGSEVVSKLPFLP